MYRNYDEEPNSRLPRGHPLNAGGNPLLSFFLAVQIEKHESNATTCTAIRSYLRHGTNETSVTYVLFPRDERRESRSEIICSEYISRRIRVRVLAAESGPCSDDVDASWLNVLTPGCTGQSLVDESGFGNLQSKGICCFFSNTSLFVSDLPVAVTVTVPFTNLTA